MYDVWNLDPLYKGFDDPSYLADRKALEQVVGELDAFSQTMAGRAPADVLTEGIRLLERLSRLANKLLTYATLRQAADTAQPECGSQVGMLWRFTAAVPAPMPLFGITVPSSPI